MKINRAAIKQNAKMTIATSKPSPILVGLAFLAIVFVLEYLFRSVSGFNEIYSKMMEQAKAGNFDYIPAIPNIGTGGTLIVIAIFMMVLMMDAGFKIYCMNICQSRKAGFGNLFDSFAIFLKVLWMNILMLVLVYLWSLLLIIPGIIALYRYRMAMFILIDNPKLGAFECILQSGRMMRGRKGELFLLDLSFLGWYMLTLIPLVTIWVTPYTSITNVNYYLALRDMPKHSQFGGNS